MLAGHEVRTAYECGWSALTNGELIIAAENAGFSVLVTTDRNLQYQQNLGDRNLAIVVLLSTSWPRIRVASAKVLKAVDAAVPKSYTEVEIG